MDLDHVGVVVEDLEQAKRFLAERLRLELVREAHNPHLELNAAFFRCGPVMIEVFQPDEPAAARERIGDAPGARIDHIALRVDDLRASAEELAASGVRFRGAAGGIPEPVPTGATSSLFTEPATSGGVTYQLLQPSQ